MSTPTQDLTAAQDMPNEQAKFDTAGAYLGGASPSEVKQGFIKESLSDENQHQDEDGTNYVGNHYEREGFLPPGLGYSR